MARSWPTPAQAIRGRRRSSKIWAGVVVGLTVTVLTILGSTLSAVQGITRGFYDNQLGADAVANAHRELLRLQTDVVRLRTADDTAPVEIGRGLLRQQLRVLPGILGPARTRQVQVIDEGIRAIDWSRLEHLPAPGPERDRILDAFDQQLRAIEVEYKEFNDQQIRRFYQAAGEALAAKTDSQRLLGVLVVLTVVLALGWALAARRRSRTDLTEAYEALRVSEERTWTVIDTAGDAFISMDDTGRVIEWNRQAEAIFGWTHDEAVGQAVEDLIIPEKYRAAQREDLERLAQTDSPQLVGQHQELIAQARDGREFPVELNLWATRFGPTVVFNAFLQDITERKRVGELQARMAAIVESSTEAIVGFDPDLVVTSWNAGAEQLYGYSAEEAIGRPVTDFRPAGTSGENFLFEVARSGVPIRGREVRVRRKDGSLALVSVSASPMIDPAGRIMGVTSIGHDIAERQRLESELRHAQKLESVGQLAAGIAHEINTPVQFVGDNVRFLKDAFGDFTRVMDAYSQAEGSPEPEAALTRARGLATEVDTAFLVAEVPQAIDQTLEGVARVATIVRAMKAFAHPAGDDKTPADLNEAIRNTLVVANNELKSVADVVIDLGDLPLVQCHVGDVNQVLLNLVVNAAHAVAARVGTSGKRGTVTVRTRHAGDEVVIEVADTGVGIPPEIAGRVFEPFFTTKEVGKGTGQGLALAHSLVTNRHGGIIRFDSRPGVGTTFTVRLPIGGPDRERPATEVLA